MNKFPYLLRKVITRISFSQLKKLTSFDLYFIWFHTNKKSFTKSHCFRDTRFLHYPSETKWLTLIPKTKNYVPLSKKRKTRYSSNLETDSSITFFISILITVFLSVWLTVYFISTMRNKWVTILHSHENYHKTDTDI